MSDLMLQAHFKELKKELDKSLKKDNTKEESELESLLKQIFNYLKTKANESLLDDRGQELLEKVAKKLDELKVNENSEMKRMEFEKSIPKSIKLKKKGA